MPTNMLSEYQLTAQKIEWVKSYGYSGITLLYVIKGQIHVNSEELCVSLFTGDLLLINKNIEYEIKSDQDNIVLTLSISNYYFSRYYKPYFYHKYILNPEQQWNFKRKYIDNIRVLLAKMMIAYVKGNDESSLEINLLLSETLLILVSFFRQKDLSTYRSNTSYSHRIEKTIHYLEENYNKGISLQKMAEIEHVSFAYLSRLFKKEVGMGFTQYLTKIKFEHAVYDLINTSQSIYRIADEQGFSNIKQFVQLFKEQYLCTPNQFRNEYKKKPNSAVFVRHHRESKTDEQYIIEDANIAEIVGLLSNIIHNTGNTEFMLEQYAHAEELQIDLREYSKTDTLNPINYIITIGELSELLKEGVKQQILMVKQDAHINYVEASHLISGNAILPELATDEPIPTYSPYSNSDIAISFLKDNNIFLFVRIYHHSVRLDPSGYVDKSIKFFKHCINVYGFEYVKNWRFIYYVEEQKMMKDADFEKNYFLIRSVIKSCLPDAKVGFYHPFSKTTDYKSDPFFTTPMARSIDFLGYEASYNAQIDFSSMANNVLTNEITFIREKTRHIQQCLKFHQITIPLVLMKWNTLTGNTRHTNGSFFRGALIFQTLLALSARVEGIGISLNTEIQQEILPNSIDTSSIALFYLFNTKRPIYFVLKFIEKIKGKVIARSDNYIVTQTDIGYQIIFTNVAVFNPSLSIQEHLTENFKKRKIVTLKGISSGQYQIKKYIFDKNHGALYKQYENFQTNYGRDREVFDYLARNTIPNFSVYDEYINTEQWVSLVELDINAIHFYELRRVVE